MIKFGLISESDSVVLMKALELGWENSCLRHRYPKRLQVLEIGVCHGDTARGIKEFLDSKSIPFDYYGIDSERDKKIDVPFPEANLILGSSDYVYNQLKDVHFDLIFIDGCHCIRHTILDFTLYSDKVMFGGYVLFHDTAPTKQGVDYQGHGYGGESNIDNYIAVRKAIQHLELVYRKYWELVIDEQKESGMMLFRRL